MRSTFAPAVRLAEALQGWGRPHRHFARRKLLRRLAIIYIVAEMFLTPGVGLVQSHAQGSAAGASCPITAPITITGAAYLLSNNDECHALIFTSAIPVAVTAPAATTVAPGWQVMLFSTSGGLTISSTGSGSGINVSTGSNGTTGIIGGGQSAVLYGDGANYWMAPGGGFLSQPPAGAAFANLGGGTVFPGVLLGNSPIVQVPNGVLQFTNPASLVPADRGDIMRICAGVNRAMGAVPNQSPAWLQVFDWLQRPYKIPLC